jgi:hypothetical protein
MQEGTAVAEPLEALGVPWHPQSFSILLYFFVVFLPKFHIALPRKRKNKKIIISYLYKLPLDTFKKNLTILLI